MTETANSPARDALSQALAAPSSASTASAGSRSPASASGPWRPASLAGRSSPAPGQTSSSSRDSPDPPPGPHSGLIPLRSNNSSAHASDRQRTLTATSPSPAPSSSLLSTPGGAWTSPSKRPAGPTSSSAAFPERNNVGGEQYSASSASPVLGSFSSFARSSPVSTPASSSSSTSATQTVPAIVAESSPSLGTGARTPSSSASSQKQPLNMEALAAKFADSKENKERFARLQLSPALAPASLSDKERRTPTGPFVAPSPASSHIAHIKVQRTASLNQNAHSSLLPKGSGSRLQPGQLAQATDMRRTASHNNAFSTGLGLPLGSGNGALDHANGAGTSTSTNNITPSSHSNGATGSSSQLAPFSLSQMTRSPRRPSFNPPDHATHHHHDLVSPMQTPSLSPLLGDKHPLQHQWTLYYDMSAGYNRQGSSLHNYENGLKELGTFMTVELFARYFNWIEKPHKMENSSNYHLFKGGIKPMWEDPANANGGRWIVTLLNKNAELLDRCWLELAYALVGEQLDAGDDICGAVLSRRTKADRLAVWVRDKENVEAINGIGKRLIQMLDLAKEKISLEFQITTDARSSGPPRSYISLDAIKKDLVQLAQVVTTPHSSSELDASPALSVDSVSATPSSVAAPSPSTPNSVSLDYGKTKESQSAIGNAGLLISVEGAEVIF